MANFQPRVTFGFDFAPDKEVVTDDATAVRDYEPLLVKRVTNVELGKAMTDIAILKSMLKERPE